VRAAAFEAAVGFDNRAGLRERRNQFVEDVRPDSV
jgi:hypothetical protein